MLVSFQFAQRKGKGSHENYVHDNFRGKFRNVTVDCPKAPFGYDLIASMAAQAGMSKKEFLAECHKH